MAESEESGFLRHGTFSRSERLWAQKAQRRARLSKTEDLIPLEICLRAVAHYLQDLDLVATDDLGKVTTKSIREFCVAGLSVFDAVSSAVAKEHVGICVDKVGFARSVIAVISTRPTDKDKVPCRGTFHV